MNMTIEQAQKNMQDLINVSLSNGYFKDVPSVILMQNSLSTLVNNLARNDAKSDNQQEVNK